MIEINGLTKSFGDLAVLRGLTGTVRTGCITGLAGPNACGKTTLVKSILGLVVPDGGSISLDGHLVNSVDYRRRIGYMPQQAEFPRNLTPTELFKLLTTLRRQDPVRLTELVERFKLAPFLRKPFGNLSAGTRQKFSAVAALCYDPTVLILDEPTAGFDPVACVIFKELLYDAVASGMTILIVSHIISELEQLVDDLIFILDGRILFSGKAESLNQLTNSTSLEQGIVKLLSSGGSLSMGQRIG